MYYTLTSPDGDVYTNDNPSGNQEWERFSLDTAPFDRAAMDYHTDAISMGIWSMHLNGVDIHNLNAWRFPFPLLSVDENGTPVLPLNPYVGSAAPVPTMSVWGLVILAGLLGSIGFSRRRKI